MKKQKYAIIKLPVSNNFGISTIDDHLAEISKMYHSEMWLKNQAFFFLIKKGLYNEFNNELRKKNHS